MTPDERIFLSNELKSLGPVMRSRALVGIYLDYFSSMETALTNKIGLALRFPEPEGKFALRHIEFGGKIDLLTAIVETCISDVEEQRQFKRVLKDAQNYAKDRNIIAHSYFGPSEDGGLALYTVRAKSNPNFEPIYHRIDDILDKVQDLHQTQLAVEAMSGFILRQDLIAALMREY